MADENFIYVTATPTAGKRVALYEVNDAHPGGEAFVHNGQDEAQKVAETPAVLQALSARLIERTSAPAKRAKPTAPKGNESDNKPNDQKPNDQQPPTPPTT